ncbi:hypothetical protein D3C85_1330710 [compost metagenome]
MLKLRRIGGIRVRLRGEHIDTHVVEQLCTRIGKIHWCDGHGEQLFAQRSVDLHSIEHAPDALQQLVPGFAACQVVGGALSIEQHGHELLCLGFIDQFRPEIGAVDAPAGYIAPLFGAVVRTDHRIDPIICGYDGFRR